MKALLVVDMINEFVYGKFGSKAAREIILNIQKLMHTFNLTIFLCDNHKENDPEIKVWGKHAMDGTTESQIIEELKDENAVIVKKSTYDGFFGTELNQVLQKNGVDEVYICGVATNICVIHTAFGAFARGYSVNVVEDACAGTTPEEHENAIRYMKNIYGAKIVRSDAL